MAGVVTFLRLHAIFLKLPEPDLILDGDGEERLLRRARSVPSPGKNRRRPSALTFFRI